MYFIVSLSNRKVSQIDVMNIKLNTKQHATLLKMISEKEKH